MQNVEKVRRERLIITLYECVSNKATTLFDIKSSHGYAAAIAIIAAYVAKLATLTGCEPPSEFMCQDIAELLYEEAYYLNIYEFSEFFKRIRKGRYGSFYGSIDSQKLLEKFQTFLGERHEQHRIWQRDLRERQVAKQAALAAKNGVPMPESTKAVIAQLCETQIVEPTRNEITYIPCPQCIKTAMTSADSGLIFCQHCSYTE